MNKLFTSYASELTAEDKKYIEAVLNGSASPRRKSHLSAKENLFQFVRKRCKQIYIDDRMNAWIIWFGDTIYGGGDFMIYNLDKGFVYDQGYRYRAGYSYLKNLDNLL